ncbi:hypothetical protein X566_04530 [Afipia sp. P52-10]|jgi:hypothetical protein|nr:hypothetical protein X566_04530 [Afipia sp. P52-10]
MDGCCRSRAGAYAQGKMLAEKSTTTRQIMTIWVTTTYAKLYT